MDVYKRIKYNIKNKLSLEGNDGLAKVSEKIVDIYFEELLKGLFDNGEVTIKQRLAKLYVLVRPVAYINHMMYKNMLISSFNSNYLFEIKLKCNKWKKHKFIFKSMKRLKYKFLKECLNTDLVNNLIQKYEKSII